MEELLWECFHKIEREIIMNLVKSSVSDPTERTEIQRWFEVFEKHGIGASETLEILGELGKK